MEKIKICHTISSIDAKSGGTSTYMQLLANNISKYIDLSLVFIKRTNQLPLNQDVKIYNFEKSFPKFQSYSSKMNKYFKSSEFDIYHGNGLWMYPVHAMCINARKKKRPYIISPHGMLSPWALQLFKIKKNLAMFLYQKSDIVHATCIHTTSQLETFHIRELGFTNPIAIIPNGIQLNDFTLKPQTKNSHKTVLFFSRIHQVKGIERLIEACFIIKNKFDFKLIIAGSGDDEYIKSLQEIIDSKKLAENISIVGPQYGEDRIRLFHQSDIFVLPSYTENFGIVVAEALACGVPVITTKGTPWEDLETYNCGWWINNTVEEIARTLEIALTTDSEVLHGMGLRGRKLIEEKYSIESVAKQMIELYEWVLGKREKPEFVCINHE